MLKCVTVFTTGYFLLCVGLLPVTDANSSEKSIRVKNELVYCQQGQEQGHPATRRAPQTPARPAPQGHTTQLFLQSHY